MAPGAIFETTFSSELTNRLNKLGCLNRLGWNGLSGTNAPNYWANWYVMKKM
jgi:hypothetical protein